MKNRKTFTIIFLTVAFVFIGVILSPVFSKNFKDIQFSDFQLAIAPFLSAIGVFISYRAERKKHAQENASSI